MRVRAAGRYRIGEPALEAHQFRAEGAEIDHRHPLDELIAVCLEFSCQLQNSSAIAFRNVQVA